MGYSRKPSYHFNSEADVIGDVPLNRTIVCNSFLGVPSVSFKYITSSSASTIKAAYEAGNLEPIQSVLTSSATYTGNLLGTHAGTLKFFTDIYSGTIDETVSLTLTLSGALDSQLVLKDTNALWIEYTGSCTFDEALSTYGIYVKERAASQANTLYLYGCISLENSSLTWSADITSNGAKNQNGDKVQILVCTNNSYIYANGITLSGASGSGININLSKINFSNSTSQNNGFNGIFCDNGSSIIATYASFLNNTSVGLSIKYSSANVSGSIINGNSAQGILVNAAYVFAKQTIINNNLDGLYIANNSMVEAASSTIDSSTRYGVYIAAGSVGKLDSSDITNSGSYGVSIEQHSTYVHNTSGTILSNTTYNLAVASGSYAVVPAAVDYANSSNISANTHYDNGQYIHR